MPTTLAQSLPGLNQPNVPDLPPAPIVERFLFENPWPLAAVLAGFGFLAAVLLIQRGKPPIAGLALLGGVVLAGGVWLTARLVSTEREQVADRTRALVEAVSDRDIPGVEAIVSPDVELHYFRVAGPARLEHIRQQMRTDFGASVEVESIRVTEVQATIDNRGLARSQVSVVANTAAAPEFGFDREPLRTWWRLYWRQRPDGTWRTDEIELLWIGLPGVDNPSGR